ncbi:MAG: ABC transporter permease [Hyphomicrobiaceae bacterium]|nr:ABC transporter permease [Hyphomicrobiaceae bacterium]
MLWYTIRRLATTVPTLVAVLTVIFIIIRIAPGDPAIAVLGDNATQQSIEAMRERLGLNQPLGAQYWSFLSSALTGDLGKSLVSGRSVLGEVLAVLPHTLDLTFASILVGIVLGLPIGILAAVYRNGAIDYIARILSLLGLSFPAFYTAILLILAFAIHHPWFPVMSNPKLGDPVDRLYNLVLPAFSLGLIMVAYVARTARSSMIAALGGDFIRTARAKGAPARIVVLRHGLRNAIIPVITVIGLYLGLLIGNSVITEIVFNRPGLGKLIVGALEQRDYTMLQGLMVIYAFFIVLTNLLTDLAYGLSDPRVKYQ